MPDLAVVAPLVGAEDQEVPLILVDCVVVVERRRPLLLGCLLGLTRVRFSMKQPVAVVVVSAAGGALAANPLRRHGVCVWCGVFKEERLVWSRRCELSDSFLTFLEN